MVDSPARRRAPSKAAQRSAGVRSLVADTLRDAIVDFEVEVEGGEAAPVVPARDPEAAVEVVTEVAAAERPASRAVPVEASEPMPAGAVEPAGAETSRPEASGTSRPEAAEAHPAPPRRAPARRGRRRVAEWTERDEFLADMAAAALALEPVAEVVAPVAAEAPASPAVAASISAPETAPAVPEAPAAPGQPAAVSELLPGPAPVADQVAPVTAEAPVSPAVAASISAPETAPAVPEAPAAPGQPAAVSELLPGPAPIPGHADAAPGEPGEDRYAALEHLMEVRNRTDASAETNSNLLADLVAQVRSLQEEVSSLRSGDAEVAAAAGGPPQAPASAAVPAVEVVRVGMTRRAALVTVLGVFLAFVLAAVFLLILVRGL